MPLLNDPEYLFDISEPLITPDGFHRTAKGLLLEIKKMESSHIKNSINYGKRNLSTYWTYLLPQFYAELKRRRNLTYNDLLEKM